MAQYLDKDALVAEIKRLKADALQKKGQCKRSGLEKIMHQIGAYNKILSFLDTLEVKEVDLHLAYHDFLESHRKTGYMLYEVAEYFFELGLKAQKGEEV